QVEDRYPSVHELLQILGNVLVFDRLMADVEYDAEMPAQRAMGLRNRNMSKPRQGFSGSAGVEMLGEIGDRLIGSFEEAIGLRFKRKGHSASGLRFQRNQMRDHTQDMIGVACHDLARGDTRLETEWCALDRGRDPRRAYIGQHCCDIHGVAGAVLPTP